MNRTRSQSPTGKPRLCGQQWREWAITAQPSPYSERGTARKGRGGGNNPLSAPPHQSQLPLQSPNAFVDTQHMSRHNCHGLNSGVVGIEVCTPPSKMPCPSTRRSTVPSHWRSRAQSRALAPHSSPTRSPTQIEFHSPDKLSLSPLKQHPPAALKAPNVSHRSRCHPCSNTHISTHTHTPATRTTFERTKPPLGNVPCRMAEQKSC